MQTIFPAKLTKGDEVRVIAPASSLGIISDEIQAIANTRFEELGLRLTFGAHVKETDEFNSSSIESRIADLHAAFTDKNVKAALCVIGGFNSNQLLPYINWDLIRNNPKPFIGYSDITALQNAILAKTGLVTYSGPAYSTFGQKLYFDFTLEHFKKCLMQEESFDAGVAAQWTDDEWYLNQDARIAEDNTGPLVLQEGEAEGVLVGANLCTTGLLFGTAFMPSLEGSVVFLEDDADSNYRKFDRLFEALLLQPGATHITGIVFGRFQKASKMTDEKIRRLVALRPQLKGIPIVANADFGHTNPLFTFPIGGKVRLSAKQNKVQITFTEH